MKYILLMFLASHAYGSVYFWGDKSLVKTISSSISYTEGLNIQEFQENYGRTTRELRRDYISESFDLMMMGAFAGEARDMILSFDDRVFDRRMISKRRLGLSLAMAFKNGIEQFYQNNVEISKRKLSMVHGDAGYSAHFHFGVFTIRNNNARIYSYIELTNETTLETKTFYAFTNIKNIQSLGMNLANQVLHDLHRTVYPLRTKLDNRNVTITLERMRLYKNTQLNTQLKNARTTCQAKNSKLISKRQINILMSRGIYNEGHSRGDLNKQTWLFDRGAFWNFDPYGNQTVFPGSNSPSALNSFFFCIK